ncbi:MAG: type I methionyl aminopeptidase [Myxococcales bacterium]|nr:type I methionyl aminopeptidase [Myxococcales bacterium]
MGAIEILNQRMIEDMQKSCRIAADALVMVGSKIRADMSTEEINTLVHEFIVGLGARPSPLNYRGFPKSVCTSINEVVCHGIPGSQVLQDGDIINVDVTSYFPLKGGYHGDTSAMYYVGTPSEQAIKVVEVARRCLELGIEQVRPNGRIGDIGAAIQEYAEGQGCSVVRDFVGHGVGREFHMAPQVPHYGTRGSGKRLKPGMVFTIEPMINLGDYACEIMDDQWTVLTKDRSLSAQFEHTVLVTDTGCRVLTERDQVVAHSEDLPWSQVGPRSAPAAFNRGREPHALKQAAQ